MTSKWCSACKKIVTSSVVPEFCAWCGRSLQGETVLPEFKTWQERQNIIERLISGNLSVVSDDSEQMKLF